VDGQKSDGQRELARGMDGQLGALWGWGRGYRALQSEDELGNIKYMKYELMARLT